jgi:hypothetical protein
MTRPLYKLPISVAWVDYAVYAAVVRDTSSLGTLYVGSENHYVGSVFGQQNLVFTLDD